MPRTPAEEPAGKGSHREISAGSACRRGSGIRARPCNNIRGPAPHSNPPRPVRVCPVTPRTCMEIERTPLPAEPSARLPAAKQAIWQAFSLATSQQHLRTHSTLAADHGKIDWRPFSILWGRAAPSIQCLITPRPNFWHRLSRQRPDRQHWFPPANCRKNWRRFATRARTTTVR